MTPAEKAAREIVKLEGDEEELHYWIAVANKILEAYLSPNDEMITMIAKAIHKHRSNGGDWNDLDENRQNRIWKAEAKVLLDSMRSNLQLTVGS